jgi:hypothetical protein
MRSSGTETGPAGVSSPAPPARPAPVPAALSPPAVKTEPSSSAPTASPPHANPAYPSETGEPAVPRPYTRRHAPLGYGTAAAGRLPDTVLDLEFLQFRENHALGNTSFGQGGAVAIVQTEVWPRLVLCRPAEHQRRPFQVSLTGPLPRYGVPAMADTESPTGDHQHAATPGLPPRLIADTGHYKKACHYKVRSQQVME